MLSSRSSPSCITSVHCTTPFKEEVSASGSRPHMASRTELFTARSSSIGVNSAGSNGWGKSNAYISPRSADEYSVNRVPRSLCFQRGKVVGSGVFGTVYQAILADGLLVAVKEMKRDTNAKVMDREVCILSSLPPHPHCVRYFGSRLSRHHFYIIIEYISEGSIQFLRSSVGMFKESVMQKYARMVLLGLQHLHYNGIVHGDIKGVNVLLDERGCAKIVGFGCCKNLNPPFATPEGGGTPLWMAPEVCRGEPATAKSDVWSVGCLCLEMRNNTGVPWSFPAGTNIRGVAYAIANANNSPPIPSHLSPLAQDFIRSCLHIDTNDRFTVDELLHHDFFTYELSGQEYEEDDLIISQDGSVELCLSHTRPRCARGNVTEKSETETTVKVIVSGTTSASSSRMNNNRRVTTRDGDFHLELATDDATCEGSSGDHYGNGRNHEYNMETNKYGGRGALNRMNDTGDTVVLAIPNQQTLGTPRIVVQQVESHGSLRLSRANSPPTATLQIGRGTLGRYETFDRSTLCKTAPSGLALSLPQQGTESDEENPLNSSQSSQCLLLSPCAVPTEWESHGSGSLDEGNKLCKKNDKCVLQGSTGGRVASIKGFFFFFPSRLYGGLYPPMARPPTTVFIIFFFFFF